MSLTRQPRAATRLAKANSIDDGATIGIVVASADGQLLRANGAFVRFLGHSSADALRGTNIAAGLLRRRADWHAWAEVARGGAPRDVSTEFVTADGGYVCLKGRIDGVPQSRKGVDGPAVHAILIDGSASTQLREVAVRTAHLEGTLGLAAGISHDFNNLLTVLVGNLYLVSEGLRDQPELLEGVRKARDAAKRGAALARQLADISRGSDAPGEAKVLSLLAVVESLMPLLVAAIGSRITLRLDVGGNVPHVLASRAQLESVITNLVINARDALVGQAGGNIVMSIRQREVRASDELPRLATGSYAELTVRDDGCGIPDELIERVFEPFFSTKQSGQGSGLGLPMVRWFAERARGGATIRSSPGQGTVVTVLLPAHDAETSETTVQTMPLSALPCGNEVVLVLSDDADFRSTVEQLLGALGYRPIPVGRTELPIAGSRDRAAAIVVDVHALSSIATFRSFTPVRSSGARVGVVVVGEPSTKLPPDAVCVPKPFTLHELAVAIRTTIEGD